MPLPPAERALLALRTHRPDLAAEPLVELGSGLDNTAFRCAGLVVRVARVPGGGAVRREAGLLAVVGPRVSLPVPAPVVVDDRQGVLAYPLLPGRPLLGRAAPPGAAGALGRLLGELHAVDPGLAAPWVDEDPAEPTDWLDGLTGPPDLLEVLRASVPPPATRRVLAHADLGAEHLLEAGGRLTGVVDWSDAALTDPAIDLARLLRDFGPAFLAEVLRAYPSTLDEADRSRVLFFARCAALEDLAHGTEHALPAYTTAALSALPHLFP